jgi:hypothetical protein
MGRSTTALAELTRLDPASSGGDAAPSDGRGSELDGAAQLLLDQILATPRVVVTPTGERVHLARRAARQARPPRQHRRRIDLAGLAVSLAMAAIATLLWGSPSAGALQGHAAAAPATPQRCSVSAVCAESLPVIR